MAIKINWQDLLKRFINWQEIVRVYKNGWQIRPETVPPTPITSAGSYWNPTLWLISRSTDWVVRETMADKNLGATTPWHVWDSFTESNCGYCYQRWNNYWFPFSWATNTSNTKVDASAYWPDNPYYSDVFITQVSWESSWNTDLWADWKWPCPEWYNIRGIPSLVRDWWLEAFLCPWGSGYLDTNGQHVQMYYQSWFWSKFRPNNTYAYYTYINVYNWIYYNYTVTYISEWHSIRPRKDTPVVPDSTRTVLYQPS